MRCYPPLVIVDPGGCWAWHQTPKVASMAVLLAIRDAWGFECHLDVIREHRATLDVVAADHARFRFAFVRDPYARAYSCWKDKIVAPADHDVPFLFGAFPNLRPGMPFATYLAAVAEIPDEQADPHFASQASLLCLGGRVVPDFVGRFERFATDWRAVAAVTGLPESLRRVTVFSDREPENYRHHANAYTPGLLAIARERYACDFDQFGYQR